MYTKTSLIRRFLTNQLLSKFVIGVRQKSSKQIRMPTIIFSRIYSTQEKHASISERCLRGSLQDPNTGTPGPKNTVCHDPQTTFITKSLSPNPKTK